MTGKDNVIKLPRIANPNISDIFSDFLSDQAERLSPSTMRRYAAIIDYFELCLNEYGHLSLSRVETLLFERLAGERAGEAGKPEFCQVFGAEKIAENVTEFLGYFLIHKAQCGKTTLKLAGVVIKKLALWLIKQGHLDREEGMEMHRIGSEAARLLPEAQEIAESLDLYASTHAPRTWQDEIEDFFIINRIETDKLVLSGVNTGSENITVPVPREILTKLKKGWQVSLLLGQTPRGWYIIEVGEVYPF